MAITPQRMRDTPERMNKHTDTTPGHFWQDGINLVDLEKLIMGLLTLVFGLVLVITYAIRGISDINFVYAYLGTAGWFVARKAAAYLWRKLSPGSESSGGNSSYFNY